MQKTIIGAVLAVIMGSSASADELTLQLKWTPQAQFAGYYIAEAKGFYDSEGLDVTILPGGPKIAPTQALAQGLADVVIEWMPAALAAREKGLPLVNIAQPFKGSGLRLACLKAAVPKDPTTDLAGGTLGVWFEGNEYPLLNWMALNGLETAGPQAIKLVAQDTSPDLLTQKRATCISAMTYNEIDLLAHTPLSPNDWVSHELDRPTLEDGLYVLETDLKDPAKSDRFVRFVRASMQGWQYAQDHPDEAASIVMQRDPSRDLSRQRKMIDEVTALLSSQAELDPQDYQNTVDILLSPESKPVIARAPDGAFTQAITDKAFAPAPAQP